MKNRNLIALTAGIIATAATTALVSSSAQAQNQVLRAGMNKISFQSEGVRMVGNLYLPSNYRAGQKLRTVVVGGTWTSVKEQMSNRYAEQLATQGIAALSFDFRGYGESGGTPRNLENSSMKAADITNAAKYLSTLSFAEQGKIGGLAICASAGYMAKAIADGAPINSFVTVAAWLHNAETTRLIYGGEAGVQAKLEAAKLAKQKFQQTGVVDYVPAYSRTNADAAMFGDFDFYGNPARGALPQWGNQFAVKAWEDWLNFDAIVLAPKITAPTLMIHSDNAALPQGVRAFYAGLKGSKNLFWTEGAHFDFYDNAAEVNRAVRVAAVHFSSSL